MNVADAVLTCLNEAAQSPRGYVHRIATRSLFMAATDLALHLLATARGSREALFKVTARSHLHDNGFTKLVFAGLGPHVPEVRLHLWGYPDQPALMQRALKPSNIHDHSADFCSILLTGHMEEMIFSPQPGLPQVSPAGIFSEFACGSRGERYSYDLVYQGRAELWMLETASLDPGSIHSLRADLHHRITVTNLPTTTLFFQGPRRRFGTSMYTESGADFGEQMASPALAVGELLTLMEWTTYELVKSKEEACRTLIV